MERILRSAEMAEIMLIPVRHHSPACSFHIQKIFAEWKPDAVLVEGPDNANSLLPIMVHEDTRAPFAIYYSYHDKAKKNIGRTTALQMLLSIFGLFTGINCAA